MKNFPSFRQCLKIIISEDRYFLASFIGTDEGGSQRFGSVSIHIQGAFNVSDVVALIQSINPNFNSIAILALSKINEADYLKSLK